MSKEAIDEAKRNAAKAQKRPTRDRPRTRVERFSDEAISAKAAASDAWRSQARETPPSSKT